jgi:head-tail adaptor
MISAGLLNKTIEIEHLSIERDAYGSDIEKWATVVVTKAQVKGIDSKSLLTTSSEVFIQYNLVFTIRKIPLRDLHNHYRIVYEGKTFTVLNMNMEDRDMITILGELENN